MMSIQPANLLSPLPSADGGEVFDTLLERRDLHIERIVSAGQVTPPDRPYRQARDEWILLLAGEARLSIEGHGEHALHPGDQLLIPAGIRHWVTYTSAMPPAVWLAVHVGPPDQPCKPPAPTA